MADVSNVCVCLCKHGDQDPYGRIHGVCVCVCVPVQSQSGG